ncbi:MAG: glycosyltransferase family 2 protein [Saprospirales bacterium]|nr:glycosyltransferase family 2 protein [Saprospirales bacterium]
MLLSVIIPCYNEAATVEKIVQKVLDVPVEKELIIVDDGSTDGSAEIIRLMEGKYPVKALFHPKNRGKGAAIRSGLAHAMGKYTIIQDADLETNPMNYLQLLENIQASGKPVIYGSRMLKKNKIYNLKYYLGGRMVTVFANLLCNQRLTDQPTCYKMLETDLFKQLDLESSRFEVCSEITAKLSLRKIRIDEVPMDYYPRDKAGGKKLGWRDGYKAIFTLFQYRFLK